MGTGNYKYTQLVAPGATQADGEAPRFESALAVLGCLKVATTLVVSLATAVWTVQGGTTTGLLDDWDQDVEGTQTRPEPGTYELLWGGIGASLASDLAVCLAALPRVPRLISRFANRQAAAGLCWIALVATSVAGDAVCGSPRPGPRPAPVPVSEPAPGPAHRPPVPEPPALPEPVPQSPRSPPAPALRRPVHHVASNTDSTVGPVTGVLLALDVGFLGCVALAEMWDSIQDDDDA